MKKFFSIVGIIVCVMLFLGAVSAFTKGLDFGFKTDEESKDDDSVSIGTFVFAGEAVKYEDGSTWNEFMNSEACTINFKVQNGYLMNNEFGAGFKNSTGEYVKEYDKIVSCEEYSFEKNLSSVFVDPDGNFTCADGMTWRSFVNSPYNSLGLYISGDGYLYTKDGEPLYSYADEQQCTGGDSITSVHTYLGDETGEGPSAGDENVQVDPVDPDDLTNGEDEHSPEEPPMIDPGSTEEPGTGDENVQVDPVDPDDLTNGEDENSPEESQPMIDPGNAEDPSDE